MTISHESLAAHRQAVRLASQHLLLDDMITLLHIHLYVQQHAERRLRWGDAFDIAADGWLTAPIGLFNPKIRFHWARLFEPGGLDAVLLAPSLSDISHHYDLLCMITNAFVFLRAGGTLRLVLPDAGQPHLLAEWERTHPVPLGLETVLRLLHTTHFISTPVECLNAEGALVYTPYPDDLGLVPESFQHTGDPKRTRLIIDSVKPAGDSLEQPRAISAELLAAKLLHDLEQARFALQEEQYEFERYGATRQPAQPLPYIHLPRLVQWAAALNDRLRALVPVGSALDQALSRLLLRNRTGS